LTTSAFIPRRPERSTSTCAIWSVDILIPYSTFTAFRKSKQCNRSRAFWVPSRTFSTCLGSKWRQYEDRHPPAHRTHAVFTCRHTTRHTYVHVLLAVDFRMRPRQLVIQHLTIVLLWAKAPQNPNSTTPSRPPYLCPLQPSTLPTFACAYTHFPPFFPHHRIPDDVPTSSTSEYGPMICHYATYITRVQEPLHASLRVFSCLFLPFSASPRDARIMWSPPLPLPCMLTYCTCSHLRFTSTSSTLLQP
jgi:hypothetical protein